MIFATFLGLAGLLGQAAAAPSMPLCDGALLNVPCKCPAGTEFISCTTYATMGANAKDIAHLARSFYNLTWIPADVLNTHGPDNTIGSYRTIAVPTQVGVYVWEEECTDYDYKPEDGSFLWRYGLRNAPVHYHKGDGFFASEKVTLKSWPLSETETQMTWHVEACQSEGYVGYPEFHRAALGHTQDLLKSMGLIKGINGKPYTEIAALGKQMIVEDSNADWILDLDNEVYRPLQRIIAPEDPRFAEPAVSPQDARKGTVTVEVSWEGDKPFLR